MKIDGTNRFGKVDLTTWNWEPPEAMKLWYMQTVSELLEHILFSPDQEDRVDVSFGKVIWAEHPLPIATNASDLIIEFPLDNGEINEPVSVKVEFDDLVKEVLSALHSRRHYDNEWIPTRDAAKELAASFRSAADDISEAIAQHEARIQEIENEIAETDDEEDDNG